MTHVRSALIAVAVASITLVGPVPSHAIAATAPVTQMLVPNLVQSGVPTTLVAEVIQSATLGSPSGMVTFATGYGTTLGTAVLVPTIAGTARASLAWTPPPNAYTVPLFARFTPTGSTSVTSTSDYARPVITSDPVPVAIRLTSTPRSGPIPLEAVLGSGFGGGSVSFLVDGKGWTGSVPTINGVSTVIWNAPQGVRTITVQYSSSANNPSGFALQTGTSMQSVNVLP
jgi:hypothetical protein